MHIGIQICMFKMIFAKNLKNNDSDHKAQEKEGIIYAQTESKMSNTVSNSVYEEPKNSHDQELAEAIKLSKEFAAVNFCTNFERCKYVKEMKEAIELSLMDTASSSELNVRDNENDDDLAAALKLSLECDIEKSNSDGIVMESKNKTYESRRFSLEGQNTNTCVANDQNYNNDDDLAAALKLSLECDTENSNLDGDEIESKNKTYESRQFGVEGQNTNNCVAKDQNYNNDDDLAAALKQSMECENININSNECIEQSNKIVESNDTICKTIHQNTYDSTEHNTANTASYDKLISDKTKNAMERSFLPPVNTVQQSTKQEGKLDNRHLKVFVEPDENKLLHDYFENKMIIHSNPRKACQIASEVTEQFKRSSKNETLHDVQQKRHYCQCNHSIQTPIESQVSEKIKTKEKIETFVPIDGFDSHTIYTTNVDFFLNGINKELAAMKLIRKLMLESKYYLELAKDYDNAQNKQDTIIFALELLAKAQEIQRTIWNLESKKAADIKVKKPNEVQEDKLILFPDLDNPYKKMPDKKNKSRSTTAVKR